MEQAWPINPRRLLAFRLALVELNRLLTVVQLKESNTALVLFW